MLHEGAGDKAITHFRAFDLPLRSPPRLRATGREWPNARVQLQAVVLPCGTSTPQHVLSSHAAAMLRALVSCNATLDSGWLGFRSHSWSPDEAH
jgi:hypothetical protein